LKNINDLKEDDFTESMQENEEGQIGIPCTNLNMEAAVSQKHNGNKKIIKHSTRSSEFMILTYRIIRETYLIHKRFSFFSLSLFFILLSPDLSLSVTLISTHVIDG